MLGCTRAVYRHHLDCLTIGT